MNIFEKNIKTAEKLHPKLAKIIKNTPDSENYQIVTSKHPDGVPNMINKKLGYVYYDNLEPVASAAKKVESKNIKVPQLTFFIGFGLGYELITFMNEKLTPDTYIVIIEKDPEALKAAFRTIDFTQVMAHKNVHFIVGVPEGQLFTEIRTHMMYGNNKLFSKAINIIENDVAFISGKEYYKTAISALKDAVKEVLMHYGNDPWDSLIGIENTFHNINEIINYPGIKDLYSKFKGKPGIVVATGPSLDKNIHLLDGLDNKAVICAADASVRVMKEHGYKPHLVTSLERLAPTAKLFENLEEKDVKDVYLAATPVIHPKTYANFPGERIITYRNFATFEWLDIERGTLDIGPSAGNMAFKVLEALGCDPIILIGQDLAFGEGEVTHASGTTYGQSQYKKTENTLEVAGNYVKKLKTNNVWYKFLKYYEKDVAETNAKVINATEGGAKIYGAEIMTFQEAIDRYINEEIGVLDTIKANLHYPDEAEKEDERENVRKKVVDAIDYSNYVLNQFKYGYDQCILFSNEVAEPYHKSGEIDHERVKELFEEIQKPMKVFIEKKFFHIMMHYVQSYYIRTLVEINGVRASESDTVMANMKITALMKDMYAVMYKLVEKMHYLLHMLQKKLDEEFSVKVER